MNEDVEMMDLRYMEYKHCGFKYTDGLTLQSGVLYTLIEHSDLNEKTAFYGRNIESRCNATFRH